MGSEGAGRPPSRWNGRTSFETRIPELENLANLRFIQRVIVGTGATVLFTACFILLVSSPARRSFGAHSLFGVIAALVALLIALVLCQRRTERYAVEVDRQFTEAIGENLGIWEGQRHHITLSTVGYVWLECGPTVGVQMWEVFLYPDDPCLISAEKFVPDSSEQLAA